MCTYFKTIVKFTLIHRFNSDGELGPYYFALELKKQSVLFVNQLRRYVYRFIFDLQSCKFNKISSTNFQIKIVIYRNRLL